MRILLIEDDPVSKDVVKKVLKPEGFELIPAHTLTEAEKRLRLADVVLLSIRLRPESTESFIRQIRFQGIYTPIVVATEPYTLGRLQTMLKNYDIVEMIEKPIDPEKLLLKVTAASKVAEDIHMLDSMAARFKAATQKLESIVGMA